MGSSTPSTSFSADALVEYRPGQIRRVSRIPNEHLRTKNTRSPRSGRSSVLSVFCSSLVSAAALVIQAFKEPDPDRKKVNNIEHNDLSGTDVLTAPFFFFILPRSGASFSLYLSLSLFVSVYIYRSLSLSLSLSL
ncbi:putative oxidoreductase [Rosa chinensis]|uniref:Putative oxidoreductase n=1 Tax=Rosa chinensis TaxID=74649 RepID=A0A2P6PVU4_ROSCH|nr:putative oxidoreductase [Rosa chinensis]